MINRLLNWLKGSTRSYTAAGGGRRGSSMLTMPHPLLAASAARGSVASRARHAAANNPLAASAVATWVTQAIGAGIVPASRHSDKSKRETLNARFAAWTDVADDEGRTDWYGTQASLFQSMLIAGEGLALLINTEEGLRIRVLDPNQLDASHSAQLTNGYSVSQGIEFDRNGRRVAYHIFDRNDDIGFVTKRNRKRVPAEDVIHLFRSDWPGQVRGMSWFAPVLVRLNDLDGWRDAQLMRQRVSAAFAAFITSPDGTGSPMEGEQSGSNLTGGLEPGTIKILAPGENVEFAQPAQIGHDVVDFATITEREIATALGLPAHAFGDVTKANYSSLKQATTAFKARVEAVQWHCFIPQVCVPVWRRWATLEALSGRVRMSVDEALPVSHTTPRWPSLDPVKDVTAETLELAAGLTTRRALLAARGEDIEQVDAQLAEEQARAKSLGLTFTPANDNQKAAVAA